MLLPLKLLTVIKNGDIEDSYTFYFFCKKLKVLLPIVISSIVNNECKNFENANIYNTYLRTLRALDAKIYGIRIYLYQNDVFYTYLCLYTSSNRFEINCNISDALKLLLQTGCPVFTTYKVLENGGIKVTKQLVSSALEN